MNGANDTVLKRPGWPASLKSIRRMVIGRLIAVAVLSSIIAVGLVVMVERGRINEQATYDALYGEFILNTLAGDLLDQPGLPDHTAFARVLDGLIRKRIGQGNSRIVYAGIHDRQGGLIAEKYAGPDTGRENVLAAMAWPPATPEWQTKKTAMVLRIIGGVPYIDVTTSLSNRAGKPVAYARGLIVTSPETIAGFWRRVRRMVLFTMLTILAVSAVLYPIIMRLVRRLSRASDDLLQSNLGTLEVLGNAIAKRDSDTDTHNYRATIYSVRLAEALSFAPEAIRTLIKGALLHDVGKIGVRDSILLKPVDLTPEEYAEMKRHVRYGIDIVHHSAWLKEAEEVVGSHHERYDGNGYDRELKGEQIPANARVFSIADVFDALTSRRPYKEPMGLVEALEIMKRERGTHFDPRMLDVFLEMAPGLLEQALGRGEEATRRELQAVINHYYREGVVTMV